MALAAVCPCGWRRAGDRAELQQQAWRHEISHWVEESCAAQGVPVHITDPHTLRTIAVLFGRRP